ncbi:MAG: DUF4340 domain-containing protein [Clostridia bacterium]|nr:DUF4340 domain-containing protein [Clostridia bacterium]
MIEVKKKKLTKRSISVIITASVLVLLIAAYAITNAVIGALSTGNTADTQKADYIEEIGESYYGQYALAYPSFTQDVVLGVVVGSHNGNYAMYRDETSDAFIFFYEGDSGEMELYYPNIVGAESTFDYTSLYAIEQGDGLNVYKITYLLATLGTLMIDQRIPLAEDENERTKQLNRYGLGDEEKESIFIITVDAQGNSVPHNIEIGDKLLAGSGYYYRVDNRDYVYTSSGTYIDYALGGFEKLINSNLVAEGLVQDGVYEPYYTPEYAQWKNAVTSYDERIAAELQPLVKANSTVVVTASSHATIKDDKYFGDDTDAKENSDGYIKTDLKSISFDLEALSKLGRDSQYQRLTGLLKNTRLGNYSESPLTSTIISDTLEIEFGESDAVSYEYEILSVESVLTDDGEYFAGDGYTLVSDVPGATMIKVAYNYSIDGTRKNEIVRHAVIELSRLDADVLARLSGAEIGAELSDVSFTVNYDKATANKQEITYVISEIAIIFDENSDGGYTYSKTVGENSAVSFRYYMMANGERITEDQSVTTSMSELKEGNYLKLREALLGKSAGKNLNIEAFTNVTYTEIFSDFLTYTIESVDYFVEKELIVRFSFLNASDRDSFYGESIYENRSDNKYSNYALNSTACETVVCLLGGIGMTSSSTHSEGLVGGETVAVGITPDKMEKYGLYANTVYFELPRNIEVIPSDDPDGLDDYEWHSTLGFTLYISDYDYEEGCRYIASDMYDVIVKVEGTDFDYLDLSFLDYYARRNVVLVNYADIKSVKLDFYMDDFYGGYDFETVCQTIWVGNGQQYLEKPDDVSTQKYEFLSVDASLRGDNSGNKLSEYIEATGADSMTLADLYNAVASEEYGQKVELSSGYSTLGAASFQDMLLLLFNTYYLGNLTEEEQAQGLKQKKLMSISFTVEGSKKDVYTYDFYRVDDRRVMVSLYNPGYNNAVNDFYITTFAFKKIVTNFDRLLNGIEIDAESAYE